jgi:hypothetical protein
MPRRNALLLLLVLPIVMTAGCAWLAVTAGVGTGYIVHGEQATKNWTDCMNASGQKHVEDAVRVWLDRGQLPMPVLPDGSHSFAIRVGKEAVQVKEAKGARNVELFDNDRPIAAYVVAWDRSPEEYRLVSATNRLYDSELKVDNVPPLQIQAVAD